MVTTTDFSFLSMGLLSKFLEAFGAFPWQTLVFMISIVWIEEYTKHEIPSSTYFLTAAELLESLIFVTQGQADYKRIIPMRLMLTQFHFFWASIPLRYSYPLHLAWNVVTMLWGQDSIIRVFGAGKRAWRPFRIIAFFSPYPFLMSFAVCVSLSLPSMLSDAWDCGYFPLLVAVFIMNVWYGFQQQLHFTTYATFWNTFVECLCLYFALIGGEPLLGMRVFAPRYFILPYYVVAADWQRPAFVALTPRNRRALRFWIKRHLVKVRSQGHQVPQSRDTAELNRLASELVWKNTMDFNDLSPLFVAESIVLLVRDFMLVESWADYIALAMRVHHLLRPGVGVSASLIEELAYLRAVAGFTSYRDPFAGDEPTTDAPYTNCGLSEAIPRVLAWHEAMLRTSFGRSMAMLLQGLLASAVLSQSRSAVKGAAWVHLMLGQQSIPPPTSLNMASLVEWGVAAVQQIREIRDMILPAIHSGDPARIFDPGDLVTQLTIRVRQAIASQAEYMDVDGVHFDPQGWVDELEKCSLTIHHAMRDRALKQWDVSAMRKLLADVETTLVDARKRAVHLQCRKQPFFIFAYGAPGVGKTENIETAAFTCLMRNGDMIPDNHTYTVTGTVKYHDGYNGNEPVVRVEDPTLSIQQEFDPLQFVSMMKGRYPYAPNMAAVELKNSRFATPKILIVTSNEINPATNRQCPAAAFARRIDCVAFFVVNPEFVDKQGIGLDGDKIAAKPNGDYYRVFMGRWVTDANMAGELNPGVHLEFAYDPTPEEVVAEPKRRKWYTAELQRARSHTPVEFNSRVARMYVEHVKKETAAVVAKNARRDKICSACQVAWAAHGTLGCPDGGHSVDYDNPAKKLAPGRWLNAMDSSPPIETGSRYARWSRKAGDGLAHARGVARGLWATVSHSEIRAAWWRMFRSRGDVWDAAAIAGVMAQPARGVTIDRLLALRHELWFRVLVGGAALSGVALALSRMMPLFTVSPSAVCNVYVAGGAPKWTNAGSVVSRVPWAKPAAWGRPPTTPRVAGTTLEKVQQDLDDRMVRISYEAPGEVPQNAMGYRIGGTMVLTHRHAYEETRARAEGRLTVVFTTPDALGPHTVWMPRAHEVYHPASGDYVVFRCDNLNPKPFFKYFATQPGEGMAMCTTRLMRELARGEARSTWRDWTSPAAATFVGTQMCDLGYETTRGWEYPCDVREGDCGSALVQENGTFVGICTASSAGRPGPLVGLYQTFSQQDFDAAHAALRGTSPMFDVKEGLDVYDVPGGEAKIGVLAARSSLRRIPDGAWINADVVGTLDDYHSARNKSGMIPTPMQPYVNTAFPRVADKWGVPSAAVCDVGDARYDPFDRMLADMVGRSSQEYDPQLLSEIRDYWVQSVVRQIPAPSESFRCGLHEALNGDPLLKRTNAETSSGFLGGGPKHEHLNIERDGNKVTYSLKEDALAVWNKLGVCMAEGMAPHMMVRVFLKLNEVRPKEKIAAGGTRTINCVPFPLNLRVKSVFGRLSAYLQRYKVVTGIMIGLNSAGAELDEVLASMAGSPVFTEEMADEKWWADWDTKHQDLSLDRRLLDNAAGALIDVARGLGADDELVREMQFWAYVLLMPRAAMKGGDLIDIAYNSSGHQLTTEFNSIAALFGYFYAAAKVVGLREALLHLFLIVYGDDVLMRVTKWLRGIMTPELWVRGLLEYGLTITPGSKRADDKGEYRALGDCTFLKRTISHVEVAPGKWVWTAALDEDSILKGLAWYEPSDRAQVTTAERASMDAPLPRVQQLCEIVRNAQFEWWAFGRVVFEQRDEWLRGVAGMLGLARAIEWRTYDGITEDYFAGRYTTMTL